MKKWVVWAGVVAMVVALALVTGCGGKNAEAQVCSGCGMTIPDGQAKVIDGKAYCPHCAANMAAPAAASDGDEQVAVHDCDGGCGMKDVPLDQLTEVNGKYYCASCLARMKGKTEDPQSH